MDAEIIRLTDTCGVEIVVCTNVETVASGREIDEAWESEVVDEATTAAGEAIFDALDNFPAYNGAFREWHGGRFSRTDYAGRPWKLANSYIVAQFFARWIARDDDDELIAGEWSCVPIADVPAGEVQRVVDVLAVAASAAEAVLLHHEAM